MRERLLGQVRARLERFEAGRDPAVVLDPSAVAEVRALLATMPDPAVDLEIAHVAGWLHWTRYLVLEAGEDRQDLDAALALFAPVYQASPDAVPDEVRAFFAKQPSGTADTPGAWHDRGVALLRETLRTGDPAALNDAIDLLQQAGDATPTDHLNRARMLSNLGIALSVRFERTGVLADLAGAIDAGRAAVEATPSDHPDLARMLSNLGGALRTRFERTGARADLDGAIDAVRAAVHATPAGHPDHAGRQSNLGAALQTRFGRTGELADLDAAHTPAGRPARARASRSTQRGRTS